jgi:hypothetical protein
MPAMTRSLRRAALVVVWLLIVAIVSIGGAGLVATMANLPATAARAELTADGDAAAQAGLDAALVDLTALMQDVEQLGELGRGALTALVSSDFPALDSAVASGQILARQIDTRSAAIREELRTLPGSGPTEALVWSPGIARQRDLALAAVQATGGLEVGWTRFATGSTVANRLTVLLTQHDTTAGKAAATGRDRKYAAALKTLAEAQAMLAEAKKLRDALANTVDVTTLTQWIDRNAEYDAALATLYTETIAAKGRVTPALRAAFTAERRAHDLLPSNTSGLVIILAEIGRGGLNQAVIGIEETRATLQAAVDRLSEPAAAGSGAPGASGAPGGSNEP